jgi:hypothetical protein
MDLQCAVKPERELTQSETSSNSHSAPSNTYLANDLDTARYSNVVANPSTRAAYPRVVNKSHVNLISTGTPSLIETKTPPTTGTHSASHASSPRSGKSPRPSSPTALPTLTTARLRQHTGKNGDDSKNDDKDEDDPHTEDGSTRLSVRQGQATDELQLINSRVSEI